MIDTGCFNAVVRTGADADVKDYSSSCWTINPHPRVAEEQALLLGQIVMEDHKPSHLLGKSPYPRVVEQQFVLGIK